jgi:hypothetical protein
MGVHEHRISVGILGKVILIMSIYFVLGVKLGIIVLFRVCKIGHFFLIVLSFSVNTVLCKVYL